jgi:hypothetical protein
MMQSKQVLAARAICGSMHWERGAERSVHVCMSGRVCSSQAPLHAGIGKQGWGVYKHTLHTMHSCHDGEAHKCITQKSHAEFQTAGSLWSIGAMSGERPVCCQSVDQGGRGCAHAWSYTHFMDR